LDSEDVLLMKTNNAGDTLWTRMYGGADYDWGYSVQRTSDGGYMIAGGTYSFGSNHAYLIRTDSNGDTLWTRAYPGEELCSAQQTSDGGVIAVGTNGDVLLVKTHAAGDLAWTRTFGGADHDYGYSVQQTSDGGYVIGGNSWSFSVYGDIYLIKTDAYGSAAVSETPGSSPLVHGPAALPNPFVSFTVLRGHERERVAVSDITGRQVAECRGDRIGEGLSPGIYFVRTETDLAQPIRIVKLK